MGDMLHERLRDDASMGAQEYEPYELNAFADEIERTYVPKHADVKGNPWCEGDECEVIFSGMYGLISGYRSEQVLVSFPDGDVWYYPYEIKRIEHDTLECINDDATKEPYMYCVDHGVMLPDSPDLEDVVTAFARDLLKRQREVLERGE